MMCSAWKEEYLHDTCKRIYSGGTPKTTNSEYWGGDINWLSSGETRSQFINSTEKKITLKGVENSSAKLVNKGMTVIASAGQGSTRGQVSLCLVDTYINQSVIGLKADNTKILDLFLFYNMKNRYKELRQLSDGHSIRGSLTTKTIKNMKIKFPARAEQKGICDMLFSLDKKIENNNKINNILEEMAQTLFKRWFIDFEFLNENGNPYKSSGGEMIGSEVGLIPENWKSVKLSEIASFFNGFSYKGTDLKESKTAMLTIKNFKRCGGYYSEGFREISDISRAKKSHYTKLFDIIVAHTDITQNADIIGNPILITNLGDYDNMIYSMDIVKVTSQNEESHENFFIYGQLKSRRFKEHALSYTNGTTVLHLSKDALKTYNIAIPRDEKIIDKYNKLVGNLYRIIGKNEIENNRLTKLRDILLPKLMSGEIRVPVDKD